MQWLRARARAMRWTEEVILVQEEMRRYQAFMTWQSVWWKEQGSKRATEGPLEEGLKAYAGKQAALRAAYRDHAAYCWRLCPGWISSAKVDSENRNWYDNEVRPYGPEAPGSVFSATYVAAGDQEGVEDGVSLPMDYGPSTDGWH